MLIPALHLFGAESVFQPYLPLQQMDMLQARSWLVGTTNQIVTQQRDCKYDVLVNVGHRMPLVADGRSRTCRSSSQTPSWSAL